LNPDFPAAILALAGIYVETGDFDEATRWLEKIDLVQEHDDERWEYFVRAVMALKQKNFPEAIKHADQSLAGGDHWLGVPLEKVLATKAIAYMALNDMGSAKQAVRQVLAIQPANQQALQMMWTIHSQGGDHLAAYIISKQLDNLDAKNDKFLLLQMQSLIHLRQLEAAEKIAQRILELDPDNVQAKGFVQKLEEVKSRNKAAEKQPEKKNPPKEETPPPQEPKDQEAKDDVPPADR
jgi:tetratricopeptide (TPR) repeat protein